MIFLIEYKISLDKCAPGSYHSTMHRSCKGAARLRRGMSAGRDPSTIC